MQLLPRSPRLSTRTALRAAFRAALCTALCTVSPLGAALAMPTMAGPQQAAESPQGESAAQGRLAAPGTSTGPVVMASDGRPAAARRIPEGTDQGAADLWDQLTRSIASPQSNPDSPHRSFELRFNGRIRSEETGSNDYSAIFSYLEMGPGLVKATMLDSKGRAKTVQQRGLNAGDKLEYWFKQLSGATKGDWTALTRKDHRSGRDETDRWAAISYDIARLTDPSSFRIVSLKQHKVREGSALIQQGILDLEGDRGIRLPDTDIFGVLKGNGQRLNQLAKSLVWLELATPDFKDLNERQKTRRQLLKEKKAGIGPTVSRLVFGLDPKTHRPQLVIVSSYRSDMPLQSEGTLLLQCTEWFKAGPEGSAKSWIPGRFYCYETEHAPKDESDLRFRFADATTADLYMTDGSNMDPRLKREDFIPQGK